MVTVFSQKQLGHIGDLMGSLYDLKVKIDKLIDSKKLDGPAVRGKIALQAGFLLALVTPTMPDDAAKLDKLKKAVESVLQTRL